MSDMYVVSEKVDMSLCYRSVIQLAIHGKAPVYIQELSEMKLSSQIQVYYLQDLIQRYHPARNLRSKSKSLLVCPPTVTKFYGARTFAVASAELWNSLPDKIKDAEPINSFRRMLKTYLFLQ